MEIVDALGRALSLDVPARRVISLVPSWTETLFALGLDDEVVGVTDYCTEPAEKLASRPRVGGVKNFKPDRVIALRPDLVIANVEENRREQVERLMDEGLRVAVTFPRTVEQALADIGLLGRLTGRAAEAGALATRLAAEREDVLRRAALGRRFWVFCPVWKNPLVTINHDTYVHDVLRCAGADNIFSQALDRYPRVSFSEAREAHPELILLPDEPYPFSPRDRADFLAFDWGPPLDEKRVRCADGRWLAWYGPRIGEGLRALRALIEELSG